MSRIILTTLGWDIEPKLDIHNKYLYKKIPYKYIM